MHISQISIGQPISIKRSAERFLNSVLAHDHKAETDINGNIVEKSKLNHDLRFLVNDLREERSISLVRYGRFSNFLI